MIRSTCSPGHAVPLWPRFSTVGSRRNGPAARARRGANAEVRYRQPLAARPDLKAELHIDQPPRWIKAASRDRILEEGQEVQVGHGGHRRGGDIGDDLPRTLVSRPHLVLRPIDGCTRYPRTEGLNYPLMIEPDHHLGAIGLTRGRRGPIEPDVIGCIVAGAGGLDEAHAAGSRSDTALLDWKGI